MRRHRHVARIEGKVPFPVDMLRYDNCIPLTEEDAHTITNSIERQGIEGPWTVHVVHESTDHSPRWTMARWASFSVQLIQEFDTDA